MAEDVKIPAGEQTGADAPDAKEVRITDEGSKGGENQYEVSVSSETPEETERPEWLDEKFESPEALAEAYKNLEQKHINLYLMELIWKFRLMVQQLLLFIKVEILV